MKDTKKVPDTPPGGFRQSLFWDVNPAVIDPDKNARYVIERILEFGRPEETHWLFTRYPKDEIRRVLGLPRTQIGPRSKALWSLLLN